MKILQISTDYCWTEVYPNIVRNLAKKNIDQVVYVPMRKKSEEGLNQVKGIKYIYSYVLRIWMKVLFFTKIKIMSKDIFNKVNLKEIDLIHTHFLFTDGGTAYLLKKKYGKKYITTIRNTDVNIYFKYFFHVRKFGLKVMLNAEALIFLSPAYRNYVFEKYVPTDLHKILFEKSYIIPNGINKFWHSNILKSSKNFQGIINFIFVGELSKNKNIHKVIKILKEFKKIQNCKLTIIGNPGNYSKQILRLVDINKNFVTYLGEIRDKNILLNHLRNSTIFIMPSEHETFGLVYIEAMSQGIPCIYSKGQGIDGYFEEGEVGFPINPNDIQDSNDKIIKILNNYDSISKRCLLTVNKFKWTNIVKNYTKIYFKN